MWTILVVIDHPPMRRLARVLKAREEVLVQDLLAEGAVEAFDEGILVGLARLDVSKRHAAELGPLGECFAQKLRAIVRPWNLRQSVFTFELLETHAPDGRS